MKHTNIQAAVPNNNKTAAMGMPRQPRTLMGGQIDFTRKAFSGLKLKEAELATLAK
jgi:hypothetical protein